MKHTTRNALGAIPLTLALATAAAPARAADVALAADGAWRPFSVDSLLAPPAAPLGWIDDAGMPLAFTFAIAAGRSGTLTIVDAAIAGDTFAITNFGSAFGTTSSVPAGSFETSTDVGLDYDAALADPSFSRGVFMLAPGSYRIGGSLLQSVTLGGQPLDATAGALRLGLGPVAAIPEPGTAAMLLAGLLVIGNLVRRRGLDR